MTGGEFRFGNSGDGIPFWQKLLMTPVVFAVVATIVHIPGWVAQAAHWVVS